MNDYEELQKILDTHPSGAPKSKIFDEILKILFTPEEAALALHMSFRPKKVEDIAAAAGLAAEKAEALLETMAAKAVIFSNTKAGKKSYGLLPTIPGLFEFPFMKGGGGPEHEKLGKLWEEYHREAMGAAFSGNPTPLMRVVPVEKSLTPETAVHPYEEVKHLIENSDYLALAQCACRVSVGKCDKPKDVCIIFDSPARFLVERGYAREASKAETLRALDRAEEAGLVHTSNNSADRASVICNCCSCCCTVLRGKTQLGHPHAFATSRFEAGVITGDCTGCGICAEERCPMGAISMGSGTASVAAEKCIGCGLCVSGCPANAIALRERKQSPEVPASTQEMALKIVQEKGKLDAFVKIMQR